MELKLDPARFDSVLVVAFNRTTMELKLELDDNISIESRLLIEPLWN